MTLPIQHLLGGLLTTPNAACCFLFLPHHACGSPAYADLVSDRAAPSKAAVTKQSSFV